MGEPLELVHYRQRRVLVPVGEGRIADDVGEPDGGEAPCAIPCHVYEVKTTRSLMHLLGSDRGQHPMRGPVGASSVSGVARLG